MQAWCFSGLAKLAQQGGGQDVLHQRGLARAAHTRHAHQALKGEINRQVFQVVITRTLQNQTWRVVRHRTFKTHADLLACAKVSARQGIGVFEVFRRAIKHNLSAFFARAGAHVNHAVGRHHHGGVVFHHHQRVACITQPMHGLGNAVHVTRVQAN